MLLALIRHRLLLSGGPVVFQTPDQAVWHRVARSPPCARLSGFKSQLQHSLVWLFIFFFGHEVWHAGS